MVRTGNVVACSCFFLTYATNFGFPNFEVEPNRAVLRVSLSRLLLNSPDDSPTDQAGTTFPIVDYLLVTSRIKAIKSIIKCASLEGFSNYQQCCSS